MSIKTFIRQKVFDVFRITYHFKIFYIRSRSELPLILNRQGLKGTGVEVGVWKGDFSKYLLENWNGERLYSVDPWKSFSSSEYIDDMNLTQAEFDKIYDLVCDKLHDHKDRSVILRKTSEEASNDFDNESLDFVYIDAMHNYSGVKKDIESWFPKIKMGGLLCGHDYLNGIIGTTEFGVKQAVDEFVNNNQLQLVVTHKDRYPSWFIFKV